MSQVQESYSANIATIEPTGKASSQERKSSKAKTIGGGRTDTQDTQRTMVGGRTKLMVG